MAELGSSFALTYHLAFNNHKEDLHICIYIYTYEKSLRYRNKLRRIMAKIGKAVEKLESSYIACGSIKWCSYLGKHSDISSNG